MRGLRDLRIELSLLNRRQNPWIRCVVAWPKTSTLDWASHPKFWIAPADLPYVQCVRDAFGLTAIDDPGEASSGPVDVFRVLD